MDSSINLKVFKEMVSEFKTIDLETVHGKLFPEIKFSVFHIT